MLSRMLVVLLIVPWFFFFASRNENKSCFNMINGYCYDNGDEDYPPLTAQWQIIDVETNKPLPGVWISFYWMDRSRNQEFGGTCVRNVIGQTDAQGVFSNTAASGAWMYYNVKLYKAGYQNLPTPVFDGPLENSYAIKPDDLGKFGDFEKQLLALNYRLDTTAEPYRYVRRYANQVSGIGSFSMPGAPRGQVQYWVSARGIPPELPAQELGELCLDRKIGGYNAAADYADYLRYGFRLKQDPNTPEGIELVDPISVLWKVERSRAAIRRICDPRWDSVSPDLRFYSLDFLLRDAFAMQPQNPKTLAELVPGYLPGASQSYSGLRAFTMAERVTVCIYLNQSIGKQERP